ncbi:polyprenol monophosphomannose synthase [Commensalibacter oyaizuii]|uniref:Polyprenol monophosphomannose synthase n=1 Tax=Commensalibacter oyaizuii TaxID=3043873 RepID=A0ABT6Q2L6_9PROT|nr:polyprenol monophosphomannose synthase [Commensalibacter sp. TBRC 16381]MDI2090734.1 polyprenol monophosphomannose synthase [Commensalibacter sp. TBRC 16381]
MNASAESNVRLELSVIVPCYNECGNVEPLFHALIKALEGRRWEAIFVDDNSPDGTIQRVWELAQQDSRIRGILRVGRRGLSSAVIEGVLASSAQCVAVIDGDMQHDESCLPEMLDAVLKDHYDFAVGSRHVQGGDSVGLANRWRHVISQSGIWLSQKFLPVKLNDPMSGFFLLRRALFIELLPSLSGTGFKILLDLVMSCPKNIRLKEIPFRFRQRLSGESKLNFKVMWQFLLMMAEKLWLCFVPVRLLVTIIIFILGVVGFKYIIKD